MKRWRASWLVGNVRRSATTSLPEVPYIFAEGKAFEAERYGMMNKQWILERAPRFRAVVRNAVYVASKEALWNAPAHEAIEEITRFMPYHDLARYATEHNYLFLFHKMLVAADAPLPHVMYEDFMKSRTFSSLQSPPEEQFALEPSILRGLMCLAAHQLIGDEHYFGTTQNLFNMMEQQQPMCTELLSGWIFCCAAAGHVGLALKHAKSMAEAKMTFDSQVFSLMMHPNSDPKDHQEHKQPLWSAKGFLMQQRLQTRLHTVYQADSIAVHALFVFYSLTLNHVKKWEVLRLAVENNIEVCQRTIAVAFDAFVKERGQRCGPRTVRSFVRCLAYNGKHVELLYVLMRSRMNELLPEFCELPRTSFADEEVEYVLAHCREASKHQAVAAASLPMIKSLMVSEDANDLLKLLDTPNRDRNDQGMMLSVEKKKGEAIDVKADCLSSSSPLNDNSNQVEVISNEESHSAAIVPAGAVNSPLTPLEVLKYISTLEKTSKLRSKGKKRYHKKAAAGPTESNEIFVSSPLEGREAVISLSQTTDVRDFIRATQHAAQQASAFDATHLTHSDMRRAWINPDACLR